MNEKSFIEMAKMEKLTYSSAGVDIQSANKAKKKIARIARKTFSSKVLTQIGLFAGALDIGDGRVLLASTDGVGTKTIIAQMMGKLDTLGIDLVHHCANDIAVHGARPLFVLDYIGHSDLTPEQIVEIVTGVAEGCKNVSCALIGGETAQMPGVYPSGKFDLVGTIVGETREDEMITGAKIKPGDKIIGLPSNGLHTNGYSLARKVLFDKAKMKVDQYVDDLSCTIGEALLKPHTLYMRAFSELHRNGIFPTAMAHITGGGIKENLIRVLPENCKAIVQSNSAPKMPIFEIIQRLGRISQEEMFRTFNMGFGFLVIVRHSGFSETMSVLEKKGYAPFFAGEIVEGERAVQII